MLGDKQKTSPVIALAQGAGTATGTSDIIDTTGYKAIKVFTFPQTGATGSTDVCVYVNAGTSTWSGTTRSDAFLAGSANVSAGVPASTVYGEITERAYITHGTTTGTGLVTSYILCDTDT